MHKMCSKCRLEKLATLDFFPKGGKTNKDGLSSWCRQCYTDYNKTYTSPNARNKTKPPKPPKPIKEKTVPKHAVVDGHKHCAKCKEFLPVNCFSINLKVKSGLSSRCNGCRELYLKSKRTGGPRGVPKSILLPGGFKNCTVCKELKPETSEFFNRSKNNKNGLNPVCKPCYRKRSKTYYDKPKYKRKRRIYTKRREVKDRVNVKMQEKRKKDPIFKISSNIRRAVSGCINRNGFRKSSPLNKYLGCNSQEFKVYLESLWTIGMSWDNYGSGDKCWNIDHIIPLSCAQTVEDLYRLNHFSNLRPLWQIYNSLKDNKTPEEWTTYKLKSLMDKTNPVPEDVKSFTVTCAETWHPDDVYVVDVVDVCETHGGYKIVEYNCFNASGFYNSSIEDIVREVSLYVEARSTLEAPLP